MAGVAVAMTAGGLGKALVRARSIAGIALVAATALAGMAGLAGCSAVTNKEAQVASALVRLADFDALHSLGLSDAQVQAAADCAAAKIVEDFSSESLEALIVGKYEQELSKADYAALSSAVYDCALDNGAGAN